MKYTSDQVCRLTTHACVPNSYDTHLQLVDSDFLLIILRRVLKRRKDLKVVLMSATINQVLFAGNVLQKELEKDKEIDACIMFVDYFGGAPTIEIPGFTHPVQDL